MKKKIFGVIAATSIALVGCANNDEAGQRYNPDVLNDNNNVEQTRFNNGRSEFSRNDITMDRDIEQRNRDNRNEGFNNITDNNNINARDRSGNNENRDRYDVANEAAERIADQVDEIERAYVLTTNNNAYVAAQLDNDQHNGNRNVRNDNNRGDDLTDSVKEEVADIVKSMDNDIENVYVSTNPDFMDLTNNYVNDLDDGRPVEGFFNQMGNMIERLFPQNR